MNKSERIKERECPICGNIFTNRMAYCTLECLHKSGKATGVYEDKRKILDFMIQNPNISSRKIAKIFNVSRSVTERLAYFTDRKFILKEVNERFFENINTEEKAYWLGFMYADGYVTNRKGTQSFIVELCLQSKDLNHLYKFKESLNSDIEPVKKKTTCKGKTYEAHKFSINRKAMYNDLIHKGCYENKSLILKFPDISLFKEQSLVKHFIRGYFEGDGCVGLYKTKDVKKKQVSLNILGTENFLKGIIEYFKGNNLDIGSENIYKGTGTKKNISYIQKSHEKAFNILEFIYSDCNIYLDRKYEKYIEIKEYRKMYSELS